MLDREVGNAAPRIEPERRREGIGRAGGEAGAAGAAARGVRHVGRELERGVERAEEEPASVRAADEIGVLALPAETGGFGERLFHDRGGIDEHLELAAGKLDQPPGERLQRLLDEVMIVRALRVD